MKAPSLLYLRQLLGPRTSTALKEVRKFQEAHTKLVPKIDSKSIGKAFRKAREDRGISLRGMAKAIGVSAPFLFDVELGERNLSLYHTVLFLEQLRK